MGISLNTNMMSLNIANTFNKNTVGLQSSMEKLSTGMRINSAGDDPSGIGIAERIRTRVDSYNQANSNVQNDSAIFKIADDALTNMADVLSSIREKLVQASDDNVSKADRGQIGAGIDELVEQYKNIIDDAKYGDKKFFGSSAGNYPTDKFTVQYGPDAADKWEIAFTDLGTKQGTFSTAVKSKVTATSGASVANGLISTVDTELGYIYSEQAKLGTYEQRLGYLADNTSNQATALQQLDSSIRDQDVATGMTEFMRYNIRTQTSQLMLAQAGQVPAMVLKLLEP